MTEVGIRQKHYGPVDAILEPDRHRYVSRRTYYHVLIRIFAVPALGASWYVTSLGFRITGHYWPLIILGSVLGVAGLWAVYFSSWQRSVLTFTPEVTVLQLRGFVPFHRSGTWRWQPTSLVDVTIDTLPMPARTAPLLRSGVMLKLDGEEDWRSTFFVFDSYDQAKVLTDDLVASANEMIDRRDAQAP